MLAQIVQIAALQHRLGVNAVTVLLQRQGQLHAGPRLDDDLQRVEFVLQAGRLQCHHVVHALHRAVRKSIMEEPAYRRFGLRPPWRCWRQLAPQR